MKQQKSSLVIHLDISRDVVVFDLKLFVVLNISTCVFKQKNKSIYITGAWARKLKTYWSSSSRSVKVSNNKSTKKWNIWSVKSVSGFDLLTFITSSRPHCKSFTRSRCVNTLMVFKRSCWKLEVFPSEPSDLSSLSVCWPLTCGQQLPARTHISRYIWCVELVYLYFTLEIILSLYCSCSVLRHLLHGGHRAAVKHSKH